MDRRRFLLTSLAGAAVRPLAAEAQQAGKVYRVGVLTLVSVPEYEEVFRQSLKEHGYVEGRNLTLEWRRAHGKAEQLPGLAAELVGQRVEVIVMASNVAAVAAKAATTAIPIVMAAVGNAEQLGLVASLAKPGGNVTGLTLDPGAEIAGKMMELLNQAAPMVSRVAMLSVAGPGTEMWAKHGDRAAKALRVRVQVFTVGDPDQLPDVLTDIARANQGALIVTTSALMFSLRRAILEFTTKNRLPGVFPFRIYADEGGLIAYGVDLKHLFQRSTIYVDRILKGARPADLPVEQPTKFELVVNLKTAKALGLAIPPSLLARADQVIE
jgi:putative ABC transport system substrate-binding protein